MTGFHSGPLSAAPLPPKRPGLDWMIVGGESGVKARPMYPQWARDIRDQCLLPGVPLHFKQWGEWHPTQSLSAHPVPEAQLLKDVWMYRVGKKRAGRSLDGRTHDGMPA